MLQIAKETVQITKEARKIKADFPDKAKTAFSSAKRQFRQLSENRADGFGTEKFSNGGDMRHFAIVNFIKTR